MALPERDLVIDFKFEDLELGELELFDPDPRPKSPEENFAMIRAWRDFLIAHSNYTRPEVNRIKVGEMSEIRDKARKVVSDELVPKANGSGSAPGPTEKVAPSPVGASSES